MSRRDPSTDLSAHDPEDGPPFGTVLKDLAVFELKLLADGLKDFVLAQLAVVATAVDLFRRRRRTLYGLMGAGERFERWLGLFRPMSRHSEDEEDPLLFGDANRVLREAEKSIRKRRSRDA